MKILLTGSTGFFGKYIYKSLFINNKIDTLSRNKSTYNIDLSHKIPDFNQLCYSIAKQLNKKYILNMPLFIAQLLFKIGDCMGLNLFNSLKLNKIVSDLTFDDSKARKTLDWKPNSVS